MSIYNEAIDEVKQPYKGGKPKNNGSSRWTTIKQMQNLIKNELMNSEEGLCTKLTCTTSLTLRELVLLTCLMVINLFSSTNLRKGKPEAKCTRFIETYNNVGNDSDLMIKKFVRMLKGITFYWYTNLEPKSINSWE